MRLAGLPDQHRRGEPVYCEVRGCGQATREGKPRCSEHVEQLPHARLVAAQIERDEAERALVAAKGRKAVDPRGVVVTELVRALETEGARTVPRLARQLHLSVELAAAYVEALARRRVVRVGTTKRGKTVAELAAGWRGALVGWLEDQVERGRRGERLAPPPGRTEWKDPRSELLLRKAIEEELVEKVMPKRKTFEWRQGLSGEVLRAWRGERSFAWASAQLQSCEASVRNWERGTSVPSQIKQDLIEALVTGKPPANPHMPPPAEEWRGALVRALRRVADELEQGR